MAKVVSFLYNREREEEGGGDGCPSQLTLVEDLRSCVVAPSIYRALYNNSPRGGGGGRGEDYRRDGAVCGMA
jgi:hypothetical protein